MEGGEKGQVGSGHKGIREGKSWKRGAFGTRSRLTATARKPCSTVCDPSYLASESHPPRSRLALPDLIVPDPGDPRGQELEKGGFWDSEPFDRDRSQTLFNGL